MNPRNFKKLLSDMSMQTEVFIHLDNPIFQIEKKVSPTVSYRLRFEQKDSVERTELQIEMSACDFDAFLNQGKALLASHATLLNQGAENAALRQAASLLCDLTDSDWQLVVKKSNVETLVHALWLLNDFALTSTVMHAVSDRAAAMLIDELTDRFKNHNPDTTQTSRHVENARKSLHDVLHLVTQLQDDGLIARSTFLDEERP